MFLKLISLILLIGFSPDEYKQSKFHPPLHGCDSQSWRENLRRAGDFGGGMGKPVNVGDVFGRLTVISVGGLVNTVRFVQCKCQCGVVKTFRQMCLRVGDTKSCGCFKRERDSTRNITHGASLRHLKTLEYTTWCSMKQRCLNPNHTSWKNYGGRGITVCDRWLNSFENFLKDMGPRPDGKTLDRFPNKNGNYEPSNCRWATEEQQKSNKRNNRILTIHGESKTMMQWSHESGIKFGVIWERIDEGWDVEEAVFTPLVFIRKKN